MRTTQGTRGGVIAPLLGAVAVKGNGVNLFVSDAADVLEVLYRGLEEKSYSASIEGGEVLWKDSPTDMLYRCPEMLYRGPEKKSYSGAVKEEPLPPVHAARQELAKAVLESQKDVHATIVTQDLITSLDCNVTNSCGFPLGQVVRVVPPRLSGYELQFRIKP